MKKVILLSVVILLISLAYSFAEVPCKINYQGRLIKDNVPVDGTKTMVFSIYAVVTGGSPIWTSEDVSVEVHNGLFRYVIGSDGGDLSNIDWTAGQELYLEVEVETEILTPREELYAYPYAINSHLLEGATKEYFLNISGETQKKDGGLNIMGNVGIGTTSPDRKLHVDGQGITQVQRISSSSNFGTQLEMVNSGTGGRTYSLISTGNSAPEGGGKFVVLDGSTARMTINSTGNVGIGTTDPGAKLHLGGAAGTDGIMFPDGTLQTTAGGGQRSQVVGTTNIGPPGANYVDMTDMSITMETKGGDVLLLFSASVDVSNADGATAWIHFIVDGIKKQEIYWHNYHTRQTIASMHWLAMGLPAGSHTFKVRWKGTHIQQYGATYPRVFTAIEY